MIMMMIMIMMIMMIMMMMMMMKEPSAATSSIDMKGKLLSDVDLDPADGVLREVDPA